MIPTEEQVKALWNTCHLPEKKRLHVTLVARVAVYLAQQINEVTNLQINKNLLQAAALLHDIDKAVPKLPGEQHPDTAVRILEEEGMSEVAAVVKTHSLHAILDPKLTPSTWEQKLLYLADKMVKYEIITVDKRFALWQKEDLSPDAVGILDASYPLVKNMEKEIFDLLGVDAAAVAKLA